MMARWARKISALASAGVVFVVRLYQATLSPLIGRQCRFVPTCSNYFIEAVRKCGPIRGTARGLWRILRCNPFCKGGYDPVGCTKDVHGPKVRPDQAGKPS